MVLIAGQTQYIISYTTSAGAPITHARFTPILPYHLQPSAFLPNYPYRHGSPISVQSEEDSVLGVRRGTKLVFKC